MQNQIAAGGAIGFEIGSGWNGCIDLLLLVPIFVEHQKIQCFFDRINVKIFSIDVKPIDAFGNDNVIFCIVNKIEQVRITGFIFMVNRSGQGFYRLMGFLAAGMTLFLIVSVVYPNALHLRPVYLSRKNVFMSAVHFLWRIDTPTNVLPSLHVFNTLGCWIAIRRSEALRARRGVQLGVSVLSAAIILATLFLKQHSFVDVSAAFLLAVALYYPAFCFQPHVLSPPSGSTIFQYT